MRAGWALMLDRLSQSGVRGVVTLNGQRAAQGQIRISPLGLDAQANDSVQNYPIKADGTFHAVLKPGMYKVSFADDDAETSVDVTVGSERVNVNLDLVD
jgi:hypothetical protein